MELGIGFDASLNLSFEEQVRKWISDARGKRAVVWVTHDQEQSRRFASRTIHLESGRITDEGYEEISSE